MVNLFGYLWAMDLTDFRTPEQREKDGMPEHATMTETSWILALKPRAVAPDYTMAVPHSGKSIQELEQIAMAKNWPGYFGAPALGSAELGQKMYDQWLQRGAELLNKILNGQQYRELKRYGDLYSDDPADAAAVPWNERLESQHTQWLERTGRQKRP